jgi:phosphotransferase system  glucose/maltose/N-acetylglucosamine-specific IIC component
MVVPVGLSLMGTGLLVATQLEPATSYAHVAVAVALMGAGMGLTLAPASESMIGVLPREQAGAGSAVNDTVQELGGTLGVAVIGSVVAALFRSGIDDAVLPPTIAAHARGSIADAEAAAAQAGGLAGQVADVAHEAFTTAMTSGFGIAAGAAFAGAALAAALLPRRAPTVKQTAAAAA